MLNNIYSVARVVEVVPVVEEMFSESNTYILLRIKNMILFCNFFATVGKSTKSKQLYHLLEIVQANITKPSAEVHVLSSVNVVTLHKYFLLYRPNRRYKHFHKNLLFFWKSNKALIRL